MKLKLTSAPPRAFPPPTFYSSQIEALELPGTLLSQLMPRASPNSASSQDFLTLPSIKTKLFCVSRPQDVACISVSTEFKQMGIPDSGRGAWNLGTERVGCACVCACDGGTGHLHSILDVAASICPYSCISASGYSSFS